jgi:hypothetical protein
VIKIALQPPFPQGKSGGVSWPGLMDEVFTDAIDLRGNHWVELSLRKVLSHSRTRVR